MDGEEFDHVTALVTELNNQRTTGDASFCDVTFVSGNAKFAAHGCILAAVSDYFKTKSSSNFRDADSRQLLLPNVSPNSIQDLLDFIYTGKILLVRENIEEILLLADFLCIPRLKRLCSQFLLSDIADESCVPALVLAMRYGLLDVKATLLDYIAPRFQSLCHDSALTQASADELKAILSNAHLNYIQEKSLVQMVQSWLRENPESKKKVLKEVVSLLNPRYLNKNALRYTLSECSDVMQVVEQDEAAKGQLKATLMAVNPDALQSYILCRTRVCRPSDERVELMVYSLLDDTWRPLNLGPAVCLEGLESMVYHQGDLYLLCQRSQDLCGYMHRTEYLWTLYIVRFPSDATSCEVSQTVPPSSVQTNCRLVSTGKYICAVDQWGRVEIFNEITATWFVVSGEHFSGITLHFLPIPCQERILILRVSSAGYAMEYADSEISLYSIDLNSKERKLIADTQGSDLDLDPADRFHGYALTPSSITFNDELGFPLARLDLVSREWTPCHSASNRPVYLRDIWGSCSVSSKTFMISRLKNLCSDSVLIMFDHELKRFKSLSHPPKPLSGLLLPLVARPSLLGLHEGE